MYKHDIFEITDEMLKENISLYKCCFIFNTLEMIVIAICRCYGQNVNVFSKLMAEHRLRIHVITKSLLLLVTNCLH